ncbi:MAG: exodeoxyribonuclease III [Bdellovibrio sp.]
MKIVSWNVNGIRACYKKGLSDFVTRERPDFLCLQETKAHMEQVEEGARLLGYQNSFWSSAVRKGYSGVATFYNQKVNELLRGWGQTDYDSEGRIVITSLSEFDLYNIYFPNGGSGDVRHLYKQQFLKDLNKHLVSQIKNGKKIIIVGDYNVAHRERDVYDPVRLSKESGFLPEERAWFDSFLALGFVDTFRHFHPEEKDRYSWWSYRELARISNRGWRIDYVCITENLLPHLKSAHIHDDVEGSDHCPVSAVLEF